MNKASAKTYTQAAKRNKCGPTILKPNTLMSGYGEFLDKEFIKKRCACEVQAVCLQLVDLLANNKYKEADDLFDTLTNG